MKEKKAYQPTLFWGGVCNHKHNIFFLALFILFMLEDFMGKWCLDW